MQSKVTTSTMFLRLVQMLVLSLVTLHVLSEKREEKRLLVNDPVLVDQRLTHAESVIQQLQRKVSSLESSVNQLQQTSSSQGNSLYVHWGSSSCPNTTSSLVYSGYAAGGLYSEKGAGSEYICLTDDPIYGSKSRSLSTAQNFIYGVEYDGGPNTWGTNSIDEDAPCAVCMSPESTVLMISGRNLCYSGWTMQYKGYLASSYFDHTAQYNYVCVDENVEYLHAGAKNDNGALFYPVVGKCGSLGCPPYKDNQYISCVVCTK